MQTSILTLMLALGLPGANSCNAQSQDLPRLGQNPPIATQSDDTPDVDDADEANDDVAEMSGDDEAQETDGLEALAELAEVDALDEDCSAGQSKPDCTPHCQGSGSCQGQSNAQLGQTNVPMESLRRLHALTLQPGSTMVLEPQSGEQVTLRSRIVSPHAAMVLGANGDPLMHYKIAQTAPQGQQDERVRELEQRVRELEAQLRERDGQRARSAPRSSDPLGYAGDRERAREEAAVERARAGEMRQRMSAQARDYAVQARRQAQELRKHGEQLRKQAVEQAEQWRVQGEAMAKDMHGWRMSMTPPTPGAAATEPDLFVEVGPGTMALPQAFSFEPPTAPEAPEAAELPEAPQPGVWARTPNAPAPRMKSPKPPKAAKAGNPAHSAEMQAMLEQMRAQMDEMRAQMQALRDELQNAPQREMR